MERFPNGLIPVLPIRNAVLFPGTGLPLRVGRARSIAAVERVARQKDENDPKWVLILAQKNELTGAGSHGRGEDPGPDDLYRVGTLARLEKVRGNSESGYQVLARGVARFRVNELHEEGGALLAEGEYWPDRADLDSDTQAALLTSLKTLSQEILDLLPANTEQLTELVKGIEDLSYLANLCAANIELEHAQKQELLEAAGLKDYVLKLLDLLQAQKEKLALQGEIREKMSHRMGKMQREALLREQMKAIQAELGEGEEGGRTDDYRAKIEAARMPEEAKKVALEEVRKLEAMGASSPEAHVTRNYLDLLCALPWQPGQPLPIDLEAARAALDADHYGLDTIKRRILQHLAVLKLRQQTDPNASRGSILLFVGPPGVGKTSLGQSIAKALGRKFARASLGGVRDDAEIRGHRRTYVGAMPGRIIQAIKRAGTADPVFMLDEIDKLGRGYQGDPAGALLEVLDPEQNNAFHDHYLDVPYDLSSAFFVATANSLDTIPGPLLDRMEVIELTGYTTPEKLHIARNHLIPKQLTAHGLTAEQVSIADEALLRVITHYTREAGVRDLTRKLAALCRVVTERVVKAKPEELPIRIELADLEDALGQERYVHEVSERLVPPGVSTGLAWTPQGGEILFMESSLMPGSGRLTLTGQLGDVMKESAQIALSLVRSRLSAWIPLADFDKKDIHIHVPAGAIPKDGPSAGTAMLTAVASLLTGRSVDPKLAMTGEITLRGAVMPVGGIKEKVIGAHRAGITRVLLPKRNERDVKEIPEEIRSQMRFHFVETAGEVLKLALDLDITAGELEAAGTRPAAPPSPAVA